MPRKSAMPRSRSLWSVCVPQMKRTEAMPEAPAEEGVVRRGHDPRLVAQAEVVVGAEVQDLALRNPS